MEELHLAGHIFIVQEVNNAIVSGGTRITNQSKLQQHWGGIDLPYLYREVCRKDSYTDLTVNVWLGLLLLSQSKRMITHRMHTTERWSQRPRTFWLLPLTRKDEMQSSSDFQSPVFLLLTVLSCLPNHSVNKYLVLAMGGIFLTKCMHAVIPHLNFSEQYVALNILQNCTMEELHFAGHTTKPSFLVVHE